VTKFSEIALIKYTKIPRPIQLLLKNFPKNLGLYANVYGSANENELKPCKSLSHLEPFGFDEYFASFSSPKLYNLNKSTETTEAGVNFINVLLRIFHTNIVLAALSTYM